MVNSITSRLRKRRVSPDRNNLQRLFWGCRHVVRGQADPVLRRYNSGFFECPVRRLSPPRRVSLFGLKVRSRKCSILGLWETFRAHHDGWLELDRGRVCASVLCVLGPARFQAVAVGAPNHANLPGMKRAASWRLPWITSVGQRRFLAPQGR